jgi:hypothetical protein
LPNGASGIVLSSRPGKVWVRLAAPDGAEQSNQNQVSHCQVTSRGNLAEIQVDSRPKLLNRLTLSVFVVKLPKLTL